MQDASEQGLHLVHVAGRPSNPGGDGRRREQREAICWLVWGLHLLLDRLGVQTAGHLVAVSQRSIDVTSQSGGGDRQQDDDKELREQGGQVVPSRVPIRLPSAVRAPPQAKVALLGGEPAFTSTCCFDFG